jgi:micrococcal nuclease
MRLHGAWFVIAALTACLLAAGCSATEATTSLPAPNPLTTASTTSTSWTETPAPTTRVSVTVALTSIPSTTTTVGEDGRGTVVRVVDGDTVVMRLFGGKLGATVSGEGEEVRLIGIDAPESGEEFSREATDALTGLAGGREVDLILDEETRDQYGRVLAYLFLEDGTMVNAELLHQGVATLCTVPPNLRYVETLQKAQDDAQTARVGVWGGAAPSPIRIATVKYNPSGDDTLDLNEEYIVFQVLVRGSLKGYAVEDETGHRFDFSDRVFKKGDKITLHSGKGANTPTDLYWGASGAAIWNNGGDTVKVLDPEGHIVESHAY